MGCIELPNKKARGRRSITKGGKIRRRRKEENFCRMESGGGKTQVYVGSPLSQGSFKKVVRDGKRTRGKGDVANSEKKCEEKIRIGKFPKR